VLLAAPGEARPSRWDRVRDPLEARRAEILAVAVQARTPRGIPPGMDLSPAFDSLLALRAATVLEMAGGEALGGADLLFFLGDALVVADRGRDEDARRILRAAIELEPATERAAEAWFGVAIASNRLRDFEAEKRAYDAALAIEWSAKRRAGMHLNRGEARMSLGDLDAAVRDYQTAIAAAAGSELHALATWGLAVALARRGDLPEALQHVWEASRLQLQGPDGTLGPAIELPSVFFTPHYEISYYRALAAMAESQHAEGRDAQRAALETALAHWTRYLEGARAAGDRYLENAGYQELWCRRRLDALERAARRGKSAGRR
jgi:tetratricopeptide (TPR) repeat protein